MIKKAEQEQNKNTETIENIDKVGIPNVPNFENNIQFITIIGEIEGHNTSSSGK